jgi:biopolymer transport protein ExbD
MLGSTMDREVLRAMRFVVAIGAMAAVGSTVARAADPPPTEKQVTLTINPDGTASWNGEPLLSEPALKDKLAHQTQQVPKLELDLRFHSVGGLSDSNRQTLMDIVEITARYGFVHVETNRDGARLTVLGPSAPGAATPGSTAPK